MNDETHFLFFCRLSPYTGGVKHQSFFKKWQSTHENPQHSLPLDSPICPRSPAQAWRDTKICEEMMKDRVTESWELPCFNSFNPWSFANSILFPNPYLGGSGQVSQNWSPDSFSSWDRDVIASEQPKQAANKPLERWENCWVLLSLYIQQFPVFPPTRFATSWNIEGHGMPALCILGVSGDILLSVEMTDDSPESQVSLRPWLLAKLREQLALTEFQSLLLHSLVKGRPSPWWVQGGIGNFPKKPPWHLDLLETAIINLSRWFMVVHTCGYTAPEMVHDFDHQG